MENEFYKNLSNIPESWKRDKDIINAALTNKEAGLQYVSKDLREDKEVLEKVFPKPSEPDVYDIPESLKKDRDIINAAVTKPSSHLESVFEDVRKSSDVLGKMLPEQTAILGKLSESLAKSQEILAKALPKQEEDLNNASESLKKDKILNSVLGRRFFSPKNTNANAEEVKESQPAIGKKRKFN